MAYILFPQGSEKYNNVDPVKLFFYHMQLYCFNTVADVLQKLCTGVIYNKIKDNSLAVRVYETQHRHFKF